MSEPHTPPAPKDDDVRSQSRRMTRRSFAVGAAALVAGWAGHRWLSTSATEDDIPWPLRRVLGFNERLGSAAFRGQRLATTFPPERALAADAMRVNGTIGLGGAFDPATWKLSVESDRGDAQRFALNDVRSVARSEMVVELKCIEGWSEVFSWAGASLGDFMKRYRLGTRSGSAPDPEGNPADLYSYVALETPDGGYYVGLDMASALQPQTLLCYEMGGEPLTPAHGAPLRLAIPVKYGIKNIKRIGRIRFTDERPRDYWAENGYDWYSGH